MPDRVWPSVRADGISAVLLAAIGRLEREGERLLGSPITSSVVIEAIRRPRAELARIRIETREGSRELFVKTFTPLEGAEQRLMVRDRVIDEFATTQRVHEALTASEHLRAVRPVACWPDDLVLVTEYASGTPLSVLVEQAASRWTAGRRIERTSAALRRVGEWIRTFQAIDRRQSRISLDEMRQYFDVRLRALVTDRRSGFDETQRLAVLAAFDVLARDVPEEDLGEVRVHADLSPSNVLVDGDRVTVLDFTRAGWGGRYLDLTRLYTQIDFLKAKPTFAPGAVARMQHALLAGFDSSAAPDHPLFRLFLAQHTICHTLHVCRPAGGLLERLFNRHQLRRHRQWLRVQAAHG